MARVRSPNYPALSLPEAVAMVAKVFDKENRHRASKDVMVKAMGYTSINGASLGALSALTKYGLLERQGDDYRVSDRTLVILHPQTPQEKADALVAAAREPALFAEMLSDFPGSIPSDDNLRSYLVRRGFAPAALTSVIKAFRETMSLVAAEGVAYDSGASKPAEPPAAPEVPPMSAAAQSAPSGQQATPSPAGGPGAFQINVLTDRLILNGILYRRDLVEDLIKKLEALKTFLPDGTDEDPIG